MTTETINKMKKLAYSYQLVSCEFIFNGKYSHEEIEVFLEERNRLTQN